MTADNDRNETNARSYGQDTVHEDRHTNCSRCNEAAFEALKFVYSFAFRVETLGCFLAPGGRLHSRNIRIDNSKPMTRPLGLHICILKNTIDLSK